MIDQKLTSFLESYQLLSIYTKIMMEIVLIVGATGHIGLAAVLAALRSKRNVLAVVRNNDSAQKLIKYVGSSEGITTVEADVLSDSEINVVEQVEAGKLPSFQHVWSSGQLPIILQLVVITGLAELAANLVSRLYR